MELRKICEEFENHLRGTRKHRFLRFQKINGAKRFRIFRARETDVEALKAEFLRFTEHYPYELAMRHALEFERGNALPDVERLAAGIAAAIANGEGFSFVRMGDGEGRFVGPATEYPHLYGQSKLIAKDVWYKYSDIPGEDFYDDMRKAYARASVIGYVPAARVAAESAHIWYGYLGCVSGNEFISNCAPDVSDRPQRLVKNSTNFDLVNHQRFAELLRGARVCVISCHPRSEPFTKKWGLRDVEQIVIAPEAHPLLVDHSRRTRFYPNHFSEILNGFASSNSQIYLIGAGIFGKIFCDRLRANKKIGLDLGSELDRIAGFATRSIFTLDGTQGGA